ncbi:MAG: tetraacyldisaccharide 4'-kinase [Rhodospirillales bacterium]|jgi:tetraacyldisaccharide 4'-kinase|nr:tetraacyldisaccharide 4'-kinase [Rhodospirillales bacterium]
MKPPEFWWKENGLGWGALLEPLAGVYRLAAGRRFASVHPQKMDIPVICVGNLVVGGAGKTPVAMSIGERLRQRGLDVHFLSRGYGGRLAGPIRVDPEQHVFADVGDEPLLLAKQSPCWVARNRVAGCRAAAAAGADMIVMDDGFQNPSVAKDLSFVVVDARRGFGNGRVLPAGPLREPVAAGLSRADAVVLMGEGDTQLGALEIPVLRARVKASDQSVEGYLLAFAGIADPQKFFRTLEGMGRNVQETRAFPDHHPYSQAEIEAVLADAERGGMVPVTTAKDAVRLTPEYRNRVEVLTVDVEWEDQAVLDKLLALPIGREE